MESSSHTRDTISDEEYDTCETCGSVVPTIFFGRERGQMCCECFNLEYPTSGGWHIEKAREYDQQDTFVPNDGWEVASEEIREHFLGQRPQREYWYFLTWTLAGDHTIEEVRANIDKFTQRDIGWIMCDIVLEHGSKNEREHYHMRIRLSRALKKQKLQHYEKVGHIDMKRIRVQTQENWDGGLEGYMSKENEIEHLI